MCGGASASLLLLKYFGKDNSRLGKKLILITCEQEGAATTES